MHLRCFRTGLDGRVFPHHAGGITIAWRRHENGSVSAGFACCSIKDNYNKNIGRQIAMNRAVWEYPNLAKFNNGEVSRYLKQVVTTDPDETHNFIFLNTLDAFTAILNSGCDLSADDNDE